MKPSKALEGGLNGIATLGLLQETLHKIDHHEPRPLLKKSSLLEKIKKQEGKKGDKLYIKLAGEVLSTAAYFGIAGLGKKKNAVLRGALLGAVAGLGTVLLKNEVKDSQDRGDKVSNNFHAEHITDPLLTIALYTVGGALAGVMVKKVKTEKKKNRKGRRKQ